MLCIKRNKAKKTALAFTLIEILVVISTIALLLSILLPALAKANCLSKRLSCASNLKQIDLAIRLYQAENEDIYPCAQDPVDPNTGVWLWMGRGWRPLVELYLGPDYSRGRRSTLCCPQDDTDPNKYESTSYAYSMAFYHSPKQINNMNSVSCQYGSTAVPSIPQKTSNVAKPAEKIIIGEWYSNHCPTDGKDGGWWCDEGQRNYLFADSHIQYIEAEKIKLANDGLPNPNLTEHGIHGRDYP